jgi:hypothetical protein
MADEVQPSQEAQEALRDARRHRIASEAVLPAAVKVRDQLREVLAANHFTELMADTLRMAAARR